MPKFKIGDHVERVGSLVPEYMHRGIVLRVIQNEDAGRFLCRKRRISTIG